MAQLALGVVGGVIGWFVGGPAGAALGFSIGYGIGQVAFAPDAPDKIITGPRLNDLTSPAGAEGQGIAIIRGTMRVPCPVFWATSIIETATTTVTEQGKGGGGGNVTQTTFTYSTSFACTLCEGGPSGITGVRRIWADSKLIFSVAAGATPATFSVNTSRGDIRIHLGTETQVADPLIAAIQGAANTPAYRGHAYLVFDTFQLADFGNHRPFIEAEVIFGGSPTFPDFGHTLTLAGIYAIDARRKRLIVGPVNTYAIGDPIYSWGFDATPPAEVVAVTEVISTSNVFVAIDEENDEIVLFETGSSQPNWERWDAATGASIDAVTFPSRDAANSDGNLTTILFTTGFQYDSLNKCFWTIADVTTGSGGFLVQIFPQTTTTVAFPHASLDASSSVNKQKLVDGDGVLWIVLGVTGTNMLIRTGSVPEFHLDVSGDGFNTSTRSPFVWNARGEIWIPRTTNHATSGWLVFNIATETFSNSVDLGLGTWTTGFELGVENEHGQVWFVGATSPIDADLRATDGTLIKSFTDEFTTIGAARSLAYLPGVVYLDIAGAVVCFYTDSFAPSSYPLDQLVEDLIARADPDASVDATDLASEEVRGYLISRPMSARQALEPLMGGFAFDAMESDGQIEFVRRGGASIATLTDEDVGAYEEGSSVGDPVSVTRTLETELPATIYLKFSNVDLDYNIGVARARRLVTTAVNTATVEFAIAFTSEEANAVVDRLMRYSWLERERFAFSLMPRWRDLEPTDVVTLPAGQRVRLVRIDYAPNGCLKCQAVSDDLGAFTSFAVGNAAETGTGILLGAAGATTAIVLDGPLLVDSHDDEGVYLAATGSNSAWGGALFHVSKDGGVTWQANVAATASAKIGAIVSGAMSASAPVNMFDHASEITVKLVDPALALSTAASLDTFYNGANAAAIGDGEDWEIIQFFDAVEEVSPVDGSFTLRNFLRGRKGTERTMRAWGSGSKFLLLESPEVRRTLFSLADIDRTALWKAVTFGGALSDAVEDAEVFNAVSTKPLSPVEVGGAKQPNGDHQLRWTRRARKRAEMFSAAEIPLDETAEEYVVEILDEDFVTVVRTTTVTDATTLTYTEAQLASDFGSPTPEAIGVKVYQVSDRVGNGYVGQAVVGREVDTALRFSSTLSTAGISLSRSGHSASHSTTGTFDWAPAAKSFAEGRWYWEVRLDSIAIAASGRALVGITSRTAFTQTVWTGSDLFAARDDAVVINGSGGFSFVAGDIVNVAWDAANGRVYFGKNGVWQNGADPANGTNPQATYTPGGAWYPVVVSNDSANETWTMTSRFSEGQSYTPPGNFVPIN